MKNSLRKVKKSLKYVLQNKQQRRHSQVGDASLWEMKRVFQINFLQKMGLLQNHYLADIGCGTLRGGIPIIEYLSPDRYFGIDTREKVLDEARKELIEADLVSKNATLLQSEDISALQIDKKFDVIWAFSVLIHMDDNVLHNCLDFVSQHLVNTGIFFANVKIGQRSQDEGVWETFPVVIRTLEFYESACADQGMAVEDLGPLNEHGHVSGVAAQDEQRMLKISKA